QKRRYPHTPLSPLELRGTYVRLLFIDYSSAFNTIISDILVSKPTVLVLSPSICFLLMRARLMLSFPLLHSGVHLSRSLKARSSHPIFSPFFPLSFCLSLSLFLSFFLSIIPSLSLY